MDSSENKISLTELTLLVLRVLKRNLLLFVLIILIPFLAGVVYSYVKTPKYKTYFTAYSSVIKNEHTPAVFKALNKYVKEGQFEALSDIMGISVEDASALREIKAFKTEGVTEKDFIPDGMPRFEVNIFTVDPILRGRSLT